MPRPLRSSCDRCHSQKLKCPKQPGVSTCTRCLKAGATCTFSPAGLNTRRTMPTSVYADGDMNMQFDWSCQAPNIQYSMDSTMGDGSFSPGILGLGDSLATPPETTQEFQSGQDRPTQQTEAVPQDPRSKCIRQLTTMAAEADKLFLDLSSISQVHVPKNQPIAHYHAKFIENNPRERCIELLFSLAQRLIDLYPQVLKILFDRPDLSECQDSNCFHTTELPDELRRLFTSLDEERDNIDPFFFNLLVSCHSKIVDLMGAVVDCAQTCTRVTMASPDMLEPDVRIPEVRVGNFVASNTSASTLQTVLLIHVASVFVDNAKRLSKRVTEIGDCEKNKKQLQTLELQCEVLEEKSIAKMKLMEGVKELFSKIGFMK
ncbi:uncharacterized protein F4822DRAFT_55126 [Hypoxylon trugodes]|uniref:uncharacterized protein n=1 Tax=Hypoxylon trugodes TaxID=326681 RepID=UPI00219676FC|nr:uncharacterized protein F4822DRAFT_55126 [Hypoxylon trugodes]KAI1383915.1 hypothetical protein F4822DRAFT_55126 [Hypoxylon trugodes]